MQSLGRELSLHTFDHDAACKQLLPKGSKVVPFGAVY